jgi:hypothetical protein
MSLGLTLIFTAGEEGLLRLRVAGMFGSEGLIPYSMCGNKIFESGIVKSRKRNSELTSILINTADFA